MELAPFETTPFLNEIYSDARKLGLEANLAELEAFGFTVIEPDRVAPPTTHRKVLQAVLDLHERQTGQVIRADDIDGAALADTYALYHAALFEDRMFEEMVVNPVVLTLARYLTGRSTELSDFAPYMRCQGSSSTPLHCDAAGVPPPMSPYAHVCNVTWLHSDYSRENGALAIVPGSHRFGRAPAPYETNGFRDESPVKAIAIEAPAGSLVCWHGNTWHGAWRRTNPGVRIATIMYFCRPYYRKLADMTAQVTKDALDRNPPDFADILGYHDGEPPEAGRLNVRRAETSWNQWA